MLGYWKAAASHRSAAALWDLLRVEDDAIDVIVEGVGGRALRRGIRVHRSRSLHAGDVTLRHGIPVTTPARTIADLRGVVPERVLRRAVRQAEVGGLPLGPEQGDRTRSDLEGDFLDLCECHSLPTPEVNVYLGPDLVDFLWRAMKLVVETDSYLYHRGKVAFQEDRKRDLRLKRRGYEVLRISERQLNEEPALVATTIAELMCERRRSAPSA